MYRPVMASASSINWLSKYDAVAHFMFCFLAGALTLGAAQHSELASSMVYGKSCAVAVISFAASMLTTNKAVWVTLLFAASAVTLSPFALGTTAVCAQKLIGMLLGASCFATAVKSLITK